jgi:PhzF family phenazine biosynthesis protein
MKIPLFQLDAFASGVFAGNPAAVCPLESWIDHVTMQKIAAENNLSETAFIVPRREEYEIRWFTPTQEVPLCGHATLASGWVVLHRLAPRRQAVTFTSQSGELGVVRDGERLALTLPRRDPEPLAMPPALVAALGVPPRALLAAADVDLAVYDDAETVARLRPDLTALAGLERVVCVTAPGRGYDCDFVSRFFAPSQGIPEDPVTGSTHALLVPYWAGQLKKDSFFAKQISKRGGEIWCKLASSAVTIAGQVAPYLVGEIDV